MFGGNIKTRTRNIYSIRSITDFRNIQSMIDCKILPINLNNYHRVRDFREEDRVEQYKSKFLLGEIGLFVEHNHRMIGSIWATISRQIKSQIVRGYFHLSLNDGLIHDVVVGENFRGKKIGPFMICKMANLLFQKYGVSTIWIDVYVKNIASIRMIEHLGLKKERKVLYVTYGDKLLLSKVIKTYINMN